ncbi:MAG: hypothetical protein LBQ22_00675 [Bacteroidales bacterium]|jgi:hypothetical protein|nr:hypothetical protein [Bacteroidales bacterium]
MKKTLLKSLFFAFLSLMALSAVSQKVQVDNRLKACFDADYLVNLQNGPSSITLEILNFSLDHAWYKADELKEKIDGFEYLYYKDISTGERSDKRVEKIDWNNINIYEYYFDQGGNNRTFYKIGDTGTIIGFYSLVEVADMFNKEKGRNHE